MGAGQDPIEEKIIQNVIATLQGINGAPAYNFTMGKVVDYEAWDDDFTAYPACMVLPQATDEEDRQFSDRQNIDLHFMVVAVLQTWKDGRKQASRLSADIKKALLADINRGGYARHTHVTRTTRFIHDGQQGPRAGIVLHCTVEFRTVRFDPYTQG